jgi:DNA invertase Pin-like site-specific DNA recombinase
MTREEHRARTLAGQALARACGRVGGRPRALMPAQVRYIKRQIAAGVTKSELARGLGCSRRTVYRALT